MYEKVAWRVFVLLSLKRITAKRLERVLTPYMCGIHFLQTKKPKPNRKEYFSDSISTLPKGVVPATPPLKTRGASDSKLISPVPSHLAELSTPSTDVASNQAETTGFLTFPVVLMCKFMDRDRDGLISLDDLFTAQVSTVLLITIVLLCCCAIFIRHNHIANLLYILAFIRH